MIDNYAHSDAMVSVMLIKNATMKNNRVQIQDNGSKRRQGKGNISSNTSLGKKDCRFINLS